jgi:nucleoside-diphosphate-sugar epimerase
LSKSFPVSSAFNPHNNLKTTTERFQWHQNSSCTSQSTPSFIVLTPNSTGGTGYIGGSVLHTIFTAHPEYSITVLLRRIPEAFTTTYPGITIIKGDYDSSDLLALHASQSDIVVHCGDSDHEPSLKALLHGLGKRSTPGYLIHLSGTGIVSDWRTESSLGKLNSKIWSDITSLAEIQNLPEKELHRNTETILHTHIKDHPTKINIAIMCPPDIYGRGTGLAKQHSALIPMFIDAIKPTNGTGVGKPFYHGAGTNTRSWVHISDLMRLYLRVVETAASNPSQPDQYFNKNGYYFAATQEWSQLELARATGAVLHKQGVIADPEPVEVGLKELDGLANLPGFPLLGRYLFASNSRTRAERAEGLWGYKGEAPSLMDVLESDILDAVRGGGHV